MNALCTIQCLDSQSVAVKPETAYHALAGWGEI